RRRRLPRSNLRRSEGRRESVHREAGALPDRRTEIQNDRASAVLWNADVSGLEVRVDEGRVVECRERLRHLAEDAHEPPRSRVRFGRRDPRGHLVTIDEVFDEKGSASLVVAAEIVGAYEPRRGDPREKRELASQGVFGPRARTINLRDERPV